MQLSTTLLIAHCITQFSNFCLLMNMVRQFLSCNFCSSGHATEHVFIYIYAFRHYPCELVYAILFLLYLYFFFIGLPNCILFICSFFPQYLDVNLLSALGAENSLSMSVICKILQKKKYLI